MLFIFFKVVHTRIFELSGASELIGTLGNTLYTSSKLISVITQRFASENYCFHD